MFVPAGEIFRAYRGDNGRSFLPLPSPVLPGSGSKGVISVLPGYIIGRTLLQRVNYYEIIIRKEPECKSLPNNSSRFTLFYYLETNLLFLFPPFLLIFNRSSNSHGSSNVRCRCCWNIIPIFPIYFLLTGRFLPGLRSSSGMD